MSKTYRPPRWGMARRVVRTQEERRAQWRREKRRQQCPGCGGFMSPGSTLCRKCYANRSVRQQHVEARPHDYAYKPGQIKLYGNGKCADFEARVRLLLSEPPR